MTYFLRLLALVYLPPSEVRALMLRVRFWCGVVGVVGVFGGLECVLVLVVVVVLESWIWLFFSSVAASHWV